MNSSTNHHLYEQDTIVARATANGPAGVAIIRISGQKSAIEKICKLMLKKEIAPRKAILSSFYDLHNEIIDQGICIYYPAPHSFTGEDILELQGHGGMIISQMIIDNLLALGLRSAQAGEFSKRAFLNGKIDLTQAEAISDLINSSTEAAARSASRSMQGVFSTKVNQLKNSIIKIRTEIEASIDFADEAIEFITQKELLQQLNILQNHLTKLIKQAYEGTILNNGVQITIAGPTNAGKSSLINTFSKRDTAIVTPIPGTTRDSIQVNVNLNGLPITLVDTAGIRETQDPIEKIGIEKTYHHLASADHILLVFDSTEDNQTLKNHITHYLEQLKKYHDKITIVLNKTDLLANSSSLTAVTNFQQKTVIQSSTFTDNGIDQLTQHLKNIISYNENGEFSCRKRHVTALKNSSKQLEQALTMAETLPIEETLIAEQLRLAHTELSEITGQYTTEDLLGDIFMQFCIGK